MRYVFAVLLEVEYESTHIQFITCDRQQAITFAEKEAEEWKHHEGVNVDVLKCRLGTQAQITIWRSDE